MVDSPDELRSGAVAGCALTFPCESDATLFAIGPKEAQRGAVIHDLELGRVHSVGLPGRTSVTEVAEDNHRVALVQLPVRHQAGRVQHHLVAIGQGEQEVLQVHRRTQHGPGEHHREAIVVVGRVVGRSSVEGVNPGRRRPADDRVVGALGQVVGASGSPDGLRSVSGRPITPSNPIPADRIANSAPHRSQR